MKKLITILLATASLAAAAQYDLRYLQENASGKIVERTITLTPSTFLSINGSGQIQVQSSSDFRSALGLGTLATQNGTFSGTSSGTNTGDQTITLSGAVTGSGTGAITTTLSAGQARANLTGGSGTLDLSSFTLTLPATLPASIGTNLTNLNASNLSSGTVPDARIADASASQAGKITTGAQDIAGVKTFRSGIEFEGSTVDANETTLTVTDPTADRTITLPDASGTVVTSGNLSLVRRDAILSTSYIGLRDDFIGGTTTSGSIGQLGWSSGGTFSANVGGGAAAVTGIAAGAFELRAGALTSSANVGRIFLNPGTSSFSGQFAMAITKSTAVFESRFVVSGTMAGATSKAAVSFGFGTSTINRILPANSFGIFYIPASQGAWAATTAYVVGNSVRPTSANGLKYICTTAGTSAGSEPTWPTTYAGTVTDGSAVWVCVGRDGGANWTLFAAGADPLTTISVTDMGSAVAAVNTNYVFAIRLSGGTIYASLNGGAEYSVATTNLPSTLACSPFFAIRSDENQLYPDFNISLFSFLAE